MSGILSVIFLLASVEVPHDKQLVVSLASQKIYRFEDNKLIDSAPICSGKGWHNLKRQTMRYRDRYLIVGKVGSQARSRIKGKYNVATPYKFYLSPTVAKHGERLHGFASIPPRASSHGCIRIPINYAKKIFPWVEPNRTTLIVKLTYQLALTPRSTPHLPPPAPPID